MFYKLINLDFNVVLNNFMGVVDNICVDFFDGCGVVGFCWDYYVWFSYVCLFVWLLLVCVVREYFM